MRNYRLTKKGKIALGITGIIAIIALILGNIYWAVFVFVFCLLGLSLSIYEFFINK